MECQARYWSEDDDDTCLTETSVDDAADILLAAVNLLRPNKISAPDKQIRYIKTPKPPSKPAPIKPARTPGRYCTKPELIQPKSYEYPVRTMSLYPIATQDHSMQHSVIQSVQSLPQPRPQRKPMKMPEPPASFHALKKMMEQKEYAEKVRIDNYLKERMKQQQQRHFALTTPSWLNSKPSKISDHEREKIEAQRRHDKRIEYASKIPRPKIQPAQPPVINHERDHRSKLDELTERYLQKKAEVDKIRREMALY